MTERQLDTALRTLSECQSLAGGNLRLYNRLSKVKAMIARERGETSKIRHKMENYSIRLDLKKSGTPSWRPSRERRKRSDASASR